MAGRWVGGAFEMFVGQAPYAIRGGLKSEKEEKDHPEW